MGILGLIGILAISAVLWQTLVFGGARSQAHRYLQDERRRDREIRLKQRQKLQQKLIETEQRIAMNAYETKQLAAKVAELAPTEEQQVDMMFAEIYRIVETGESDLTGLFQINPDPTDLELELLIGPSAYIVANESLIGEIENLWTAKVMQERADRELAKKLAFGVRQKAITERRLKARVALAERKFKWWHRRALRGLCCAACFGEHPTEICVGDRFRARRVPSSTMSPYSEKLGMYGVWEMPDLSKHEPTYLMKAPGPTSREWWERTQGYLNAGFMEVEEVRSWGSPDPIVVKRSPRASIG